MNKELKTVPKILKAETQLVINFSIIFPCSINKPRLVDDILQVCAFGCKACL